MREGNGACNGAFLFDDKGRHPLRPVRQQSPFCAGVIKEPWRQTSCWECHRWIRLGFWQQTGERLAAAWKRRKGVPL
mgnify:CR=1 FL=1